MKIREVPTPGGFGYVRETDECCTESAGANCSAFPLRRVVKRDFYSDKHCRAGEGSIAHTLECGHVVYAKQSHGTPRRKRCRYC